jgi:hypothetical protein
VTASDRGGGSSVAAMITESSTVFGRPERGSSASPAIPCSTNRSRHLITVGRDTPTSRAVPEVPFPPATASTIRARSTWLARIDRDRTHDCNVARSSSLITSAAASMPHSQGPPPVNQLTTRHTRSSVTMTVVCFAITAILTVEIRRYPIHAVCPTGKSVRVRTSVFANRTGPTGFVLLRVSLNPAAYAAGCMPVTVVQPGLPVLRAVVVTATPLSAQRQS